MAIGRTVGPWLELTAKIAIEGLCEPLALASSSGSMGQQKASLQPLHFSLRVSQSRLGIHGPLRLGLACKSSRLPAEESGVLNESTIQSEAQKEGDSERYLAGPVTIIHSDLFPGPTAKLY